MLASVWEALEAEKWWERRFDMTEQTWRQKRVELQIQIPLRPRNELTLAW